MIPACSSVWFRGAAAGLLLVLLIVPGARPVRAQEAPAEAALLRRVLVAQVARYPAMTVQDLYKLLHQAALGSEHAVPDPAAARRWMAWEWAALPPGPPEPLIDTLSPGIVRVHLRPYKAAGGDPDALVEAFVATANSGGGGTERLARYGRLAVEWAGEGVLPFSPAEVSAYLADRAAQGFPAVHHSAAYEAAYGPAYRVVATRHLPRLRRALGPDTTAVYKIAGTDTLRLHLFFPEGHTPDDRRAAIVFFFGGGWTGGTPTPFYPHARYFAARGMVAATAEYRVRSRHGTTPFESVRDGVSAVRWMRTHAAELGIDPDRIAAGGGSAGGHVAAATALLEGFDEPDADRSVSARPDALVLFNPVIDNGPGGYGYDRIGARYRSFSPLHNIRPGAPPTVVFLGTEDRLVPVATLRAFDRRMEAAGARCDVYYYGGQGHGFFNYRDGSNPYYLRTLQAADRFLASLGYLEGPPPLE